MNFNFFRTIESDLYNHNTKRTFVYTTDSKKIFYFTSNLTLIEISNYKIIHERSDLDKYPYINVLFVLEDESTSTCELFKYDNVLGFREVTTNNDIITIAQSENPILVSTLEDGDNGGIAPVTMSDLVMTRDGARSLQSIIDDPISLHVGKYEFYMEYIDITNSNIKEYILPTPFMGYDITKTSSFLVFINDVKLDESEFEIITDTKQIVFKDSVNLVDGGRVMILFHYHRAIDMTGLVITHNNLSDVMGVEWENAQYHLNNFNNPHRVFKSHVGLGNVQDYPIATNSQATSGTSDDTYMTPLKTKMLIREVMNEGYVQYASYRPEVTNWAYTYTTAKSYTIPTANYDPDLQDVWLFLDGLKLKKGEDYNISSRTVNLLITPETNSVIDHIIIKIVPNEQDKTPVSSLKASYTWTASSGSLDTFSIPTSLLTSSCRVELYYKGLRLAEDVDYTINTNIVTLTNQIEVNESIICYVYETYLDYLQIHNAPMPVDNLNSDSTDDFLTARQGKILNSKIPTNISTFRVSGNVETVVVNNGTTTRTIRDNLGVTLCTETTSMVDGNEVIETVVYNPENGSVKDRLTVKNIVQSSTTTRIEYY